MTGDEHRAIREALGLSRPGLAALIGGSRDGSLIKKRETEEIAITAAAESELLTLKTAYEAGRPLAGAAADAARAKRSVVASQPAATPLHAARLRLGISQDKMLDQLGEAADCIQPARSSYQAWERGRRPTPQWVLDAADDLEENGLFETPSVETTTGIGLVATSVLGAVIIGGAIGGLAWLAKRAVNAA